MASPNCGRGGSEGRDGWVWPSCRQFTGAFMPSSSRFAYEPIEDPNAEEERDPSCQANNNARNQSSGGGGSGGSSRGPFQGRVAFWGAVFCAGGLFLVTEKTFLRRDTPPVLSSPSASLLSAAPSSIPPSSSPPPSPSLQRSPTDIGSIPAASFSRATADHGKQSGGAVPLTESSYSTSSSLFALGVRVSNKYQTTSNHRAHGQQQRQQKLTYPWANIAEPHADTRLEAFSFLPGNDAEDDHRGLTYRWEMDGAVLGYGAAITTVFRTPGLFKCSVTAYHAPDSSDTLGSPRSGREVAGESATTRFEVAVKYVRREIRALTDRDREVFFNAVSVMQRVPGAVGRLVYGPKYYSRDYFTRMHLYYGGDRDCNHWHGGPGFVTSHIALSLMFEQSLQAIDPSIALPYWDFTVEGTYYGWSDFRSSSVFSDDWFGDAAPSNDMKTPDRGRFAFVPTMLNATEYSIIFNAYGMLRSPTNNEPNLFLTRDNHEIGVTNRRKPSGCQEYHDALQANTWIELTEHLNGGAHEHIHEIIGGSWSPQATDFAEKDSEALQLFAHTFTPLQKMLWRAGYMEGLSSCDLNQTWEECRSMCLMSAFEGKTSAEILQDSGALAAGMFYDKTSTFIYSLVDEEGNAFEAIPGYSKEDTKDIYDDMLQAVCTPMKTGTHYQASSTDDPTFWLLHPAFDRLWHLSRLEDNPTFDQTWASDGICYCNNPGDIQPFHDLFLLGEQGANDADARFPPSAGAVEGVKHYYSNADLYAKLKPDEMSIPYVYEHFDWAHCEEQGISIGGSD